MSGVPPGLARDADASEDPGYLQERMTQFSVPHTVEPVDGHVDGVVTGTRLGMASLAFVRYGAPTRVYAAPTGERLCWTLPVRAMQVVMASRHTTQTRGFLLQTEQPTLMIPSPQRGAVVATASMHAIQAHLETLVGEQQRTLRVDTTNSQGISGRHLDAAWRYVAGSMALVNDPPRAVRASLGETLMTAMLLSLPEAAPLLAEPESREPHAVLARRAADWAADNFDRPVQVTDWARGVGVSVRYLQKIIRSEFDATPSELLKRMRLECAQRLLDEADPSRTVTSIALECGFTHLGRFAAAYRRMYGVSPGQVLGSRRGCSR